MFTSRIEQRLNLSDFPPPETKTAILSTFTPAHFYLDSLGRLVGARLRLSFFYRLWSIGSNRWLDYSSLITAVKEKGPAHRRDSSVLAFREK